uniref:Uncharacterized protein n=1 Tax=Rhizophora mucronata TaxID=61149 RepID=A0A2P2PR15_RHIMU
MKAVTLRKRKKHYRKRRWKQLRQFKHQWRRKEAASLAEKKGRGTTCC